MHFFFRLYRSPYILLLITQLNFYKKRNHLFVCKIFVVITNQQLKSCDLWLTRGTRIEQTDNDVFINIFTFYVSLYLTFNIFVQKIIKHALCYEMSSAPNTVHLCRSANTWLKAEIIKFGMHIIRYHL